MVSAARGATLPASLLLRPSGARISASASTAARRRLCKMDIVCEVCGDVGYRELLAQCIKCKNSARHLGIMKIGHEYISLAAHLSNQACKEVQELSLSLPALMKVTKHSKLKAWPGRWKASEPTAECIGLYFFSDNMRELDQLVHYLSDHSLILKYVVGFAKLLIFPSVFLPEKCQMFEGKYYLWGVFKCRMGTRKQVPQRNRRFVHHRDAK